MHAAPETPEPSTPEPMPPEQTASERMTSGRTTPERTTSGPMIPVLIRGGQVVTPTGTRSGIRVLLTLLMQPETAGERTVRDVADAAGVSVGSAQSVLADLRERRYLYDGGLDRTGVLFEAWVAGYLSDRSLQRPRALFTHGLDWWDRADVRDALRGEGAVLGGEDAAAELGLPLRGASGILYAPEPPTATVRAARLRRDEEGTLQWRARWWRPAPGELVAPTPLIYADLLASDDPRQAEVAAELRRNDALLRRLDAN